MVLIGVSMGLFALVALYIYLWIKEKQVEIKLKRVGDCIFGHTFGRIVLRMRTRFSSTLAEINARREKRLIQPITQEDIKGSRVGRRPLTDDEWKKRHEQVEAVLEKAKELLISEEKACERLGVSYDTFKNWKRHWVKKG